MRGVQRHSELARGRHSELAHPQVDTVAASCAAAGFGLKHAPKIIDSKAGIPQESAKRAFRNLRMIGNDQPPVGRLAVAKDDVATSLPIDGIAKPTKDFYQLSAG